MAEECQFDHRRRDRGEDFDEEEVWAVTKDESPKVWNSNESSISTTARHHHLSVSRMPKSVNGHAECVGGGNVLLSAPINIPDWSKVYRKKRSSEIHAWYHGMNPFGSEIGCLESDDVTTYLDDDDDDQDEDEDMIPPHEWISMKLARSRISSFSVFEGRGRTLKGRDLSMVRNAVLSSTGFLE